MWTNVTKGTVIQGGSTITQQLARTCFYPTSGRSGESPKESIRRLGVGAKYQKSHSRELCQRDLSRAGRFRVDLRRRRASHRYFGKRVDTPVWEEAALLVRHD